MEVEIYKDRESWLNEEDSIDSFIVEGMEYNELKDYFRKFNNNIYIILHSFSESKGYTKSGFFKHLEELRKAERKERIESKKNNKVGKR